MSLSTYLSIFETGIQPVLHRAVSHRRSPLIVYRRSYALKSSLKGVQNVLNPPKGSIGVLEQAHASKGLIGVLEQSHASKGFNRGFRAGSRLKGFL